MAYESPKLSLGTITAAADLSAKQFYAVKITSTGVNIASSQGEDVFGILQNKPKAAQATEVAFVGVAKAILGGTVSTVNTRLITDNTGKLIASTGSAAYQIARALETGVSGDIITVLVGLDGHLTP